MYPHIFYINMASHSNNKRIAKNTFFLYIRMIVIMLVTLYTSRVVLAELGVDDYGVYMVVGGVVTMFSFLNACMTTATQRYLNYEMGHNGDSSPQLKLIFSTSLTIHLIISGIVVVFAETIGLWFVNCKLVIPAESMTGANIVYQTAILSFCINIIRVPFNAAIIAHEKMHIYAFVSIAEAVLQLSSAYLLIFVTADKLGIYGGLTVTVQLFIGLTYILICHRLFRECRFRLSYVPTLFKEMLAFAGWNMFGSIAWIMRGQGMGIILNVFFGPALNAAKGIADQVSSAVNSLTHNFQVALNPQITKSYAAGEINSMELLTYRGIKFSSLLIWLMALPIILNANEILAIWLTEVPPYASLFVILILFDCFSGSLFGSPLMTSLSATGNIRAYQITVSCVLILILPAAYFALKMGMPPQSIFYLNILFNILAGIVRFWFSHHQIGFSAKFYIRYAFIPTLLIVIISSLPPLALKQFVIQSFLINKFLSMFYLVFTSLASVMATSWFLGFSNKEKESIRCMIRAKLKR